MTRIISGRFRGRRLSVPKGTDIRPTTDRMRERLFSILGNKRYPALAGAHVADMFAGTGALGLEALSRGAAHVTFVEKARGSLDCLRANISALGAEADTKIIMSDAAAVTSPAEPFDIIFMDPPYRQGLLRPTLDHLIATNWLKGETAIICELASDEAVDIPPRLEIVDDRQQGKQRIIILMQASADK